MKNERIIPKGYELIAKDERFGFEVWGNLNVTTPTGKTRIYALAFGGKRSKPDWHFAFQDEARLKAKIEETLSGFMYWHEKKAERKAERSKAHDVKIGDIFRCSWGYDQTNIDFYQVTKVIGAMVEIREICQMSEETMSMQGECVPSVDNFRGEPMKKRVSMVCGEPSIKIYSFASAYRMKPLAKIGDKAVYESSHWTAYA